MDRKDGTDLRIKSLRAGYKEQEVIKDLSLEVKNREFVAIIGRSGCGKTTLLNAIAGFISYEGKIEKPEKVGIVFQSYAVFPWLSAEKNISFGMKHSKREAEQEAEHYLSMIELKNKRSLYPFQLSGGQNQRVALARTLAANPSLILMDEPYGALDPYTREKMQQWLLRIWKDEKKTIVFVTHSIEEAIFLSDRVLLLKNGKISKGFKVNMPRPRKANAKFDPAFLELRKKITKEIYGGDDVVISD